MSWGYPNPRPLDTRSVWCDSCGHPLAAHQIDPLDNVWMGFSAGRCSATEYVPGKDLRVRYTYPCPCKWFSHD